MIISFCAMYAFLFDTLVSLIHCHNMALLYLNLFSYTQCLHYFSGTLQYMDTLGTKITCPDQISVLILEENNAYLYKVGTRSGVLINQAFLFQGCPLEGFHCISSYGTGYLQNIHLLVDGVVLSGSLMQGAVNQMSHPFTFPIMEGVHSIRIT